MSTDAVPFFRPDVGEAEAAEVAAAVRSGWLTTGPRTKRFETSFAEAVGGAHAVALNSCTAALHLALEALGVEAGDAVLVPTMTFAATAEVVRYLGATPVLVDCDPVTLNIDLADADRKLEAVRAGTLARNVPKGTRVVGIVPVHVGGLMCDMDAVNAWAATRDLWVVEDAAHAFPASFRSGAAWKRCGEGTSAVACFSFYANKTITTGEGGMAVTDDAALADRMRLMSLHGLSHDAWNRYSGGRAWDYRILAPGYKYNMTDVAAALGLVQLGRAEAMRKDREATARLFREALADVAELELPPDPTDRVHAWHLFPIRLVTGRLALSRDAFVDALKDLGIGCSVHYRPLHLHPYYQDTYGWRPEDLPVATDAFSRIVSLPLFPGMRADEKERVIEAVRRLSAEHRRMEAA